MRSLMVENALKDNFANNFMFIKYTFPKLHFCLHFWMDGYLTRTVPNYLIFITMKSLYCTSSDVVTCLSKNVNKNTDVSSFPRSKL